MVPFYSHSALNPRLFLGNDWMFELTLWQTASHSPLLWDESPAVRLVFRLIWEGPLAPPQRLPGAQVPTRKSLLSFLVALCCELRRRRAECGACGSRGRKRREAARRWGSHGAPDPSWTPLSDLWPLGSAGGWKDAPSAPPWGVPSSFTHNPLPRVETIRINILIN